MMRLLVVRSVVSTVALGVLVALAWGPARYLTQDEQSVASIGDVVLGAAPDAPSQLSPWPTGVVDTATLVPGRAAPAGEPVAKPVTPEEARAAEARSDTITVVGAPGDPVTGVGAVVTEDDVAALASLADPERTADVRFLVDPAGAALSVFGVDGAPDRAAQVVRSGAGSTAVAALDRHPEVADLVRVWAQIRPELTALVPSRPTGPTGAILAATGLDPGVGTPVMQPGSRPWRSVVARTVTRELLPALLQGRPPLSAALLAEQSPAGLLALGTDSPELTARGAAYAVAARVVQPESRPMAVQAPSDLVAQAYARPGGGASLLVWNPGGARELTLQFPEGDRFLQVRVTVAAHALTGVALAAR